MHTTEDNFDALWKAMKERVRAARGEQNEQPQRA